MVRKTNWQMARAVEKSSRQPLHELDTEWRWEKRSAFNSEPEGRRQLNWLTVNSFTLAKLHPSQTPNINKNNTGLWRVYLAFSLCQREHHLPIVWVWMVCNVLNYYPRTVNTGRISWVRRNNGTFECCPNYYNKMTLVITFVLLILNWSCTKSE